MKPAERAKNRLRSAAWRRHNAQRLMADVRKASPCTDCGCRYPSIVMDFDHRDPSSKVASIALMVQNKANHRTLLAEMDKCDVVCSNCHRVRTFNRLRDNEANDAEFQNGVMQ